MFPKSEKKKIKAVLFDLGKVVLHFDFRPAFKRLSKTSGLSPREIEDYFARSGLEVPYDGGKISSRQFYQKIKEELKHGLEYGEFRRIWNEIFTPNREIARLIKRLHGRYRLVLISNTNAMHYRYVRRTYPAMRQFDRQILSFKEKVRKPDERIYRTAIRACRARPEEIFYIDDREDLTAAAGKLGLRTFTFRRNPRELLKRMKELGIR